jgi:nitrous oxide reductase accessory protein NosL
MTEKQTSTKRPETGARESHRAGNGTTSEELERSLAVSRRQVLGATAGGAVLALAGCLGDSEEVPEPVALDQGQSCDQCNMQIDVHPGPVGQAYYLENTPSDLPDDRENGHARFCSAWCTYTYVLERADRGTEPAGSYLTDYSAVDYTLSEDGGTTVISAHLGADAFARATGLTYAVDSDVEGAMGASLIGFSSADDAEAFVKEYGGTPVDHEDVTRQTVASLS